MAEPPRDSAAVERITAVLEHVPAGLLLDINGTISPIAPTPEAARVSPETAAALDRLAGRLAVVAALTGRAAGDAARLVGARRLRYVGNHGLEWCAPDGATTVDPAVVPFVPAIAATLREAEARAVEAGLTDLLFENKGVTASIHYRLTPDPPATVATLRALVAPLVAAAGLRLTEGRMVLEIRPPTLRNKGTALGTLLDEQGLRGAVFFGDDVTDLDAIDELQRRRDAGAITGLAVGVAGAGTPPALRDRADLMLDGVERATTVLAAVAARLDKPQNRSAARCVSWGQG